MEKGIKNKNPTKKRLIISVILVAVLVTGFYLATYSITKYTGFLVSDKTTTKEKDFNLCIQEKDITLYINSNQPSSTLKNIQLSDYLKNVKIMNCLRNKQICLEKGITSFPTWIINDNKIENDISIEDLIKFSDCKF